MSEENLTRVSAGEDGSADDTQNISAHRASVGFYLSAARQARGISIGEAASALKLSTRQVQAIEADDWSRLPRTVTRGFVRNYARYLGEDAAPLLAEMDNQSSARLPELALTTGAPVSMPKEGRVGKQNSLLVVSGLIVLVVAVLIYYLLPAGWLDSGIETLQNLISPKPASEVSINAPEPVLVPESSSSVTHAAPVPELLPQPLPEPVAAVQAAPEPAPAPSGKGQLAFSFTKPSWTEVRDGKGQIIFSRLNPAGSHQEVSGEPPFTVTIGNASQVTLNYKGKPVDLSKRTKDDVARLTLE